MLVVSMDITIRDEDGVNDFSPMIVRDVAVYHTNELPDNYRLVDTIAQGVRRLFHRQRNSITVPGWTVSDIQASIPVNVSVEQDKITGRVVELSVRTARLA